MRAASVLLFFAVLVQKPMVRLVPMTVLERVCGTPDDVDACTQFVAYALDARCVARDGVTRIDATVTFRPWILLNNARELNHEQLHIDDVRRFAAEYVTELERNSYETESECDVRARAEASTFGEVMRGFAERSNLERHPSLRATSIPSRVDRARRRSASTRP